MSQRTNPKRSATLVQPGNEQDTPRRLPDLDKLSQQELAAFLLCHCVGPSDYALARTEVCHMGLDPDKIPHAPPGFKTAEELATEQGIKPIENFDEIVGQGADLWADDAEFEEFLRYLRESRSRRAGG